MSQTALFPRKMEANVVDIDLDFYDGATEVLEKLAKLPEPEEVLKLRPSTSLQTRIEELIAKSKEDEGLTMDEGLEWERFEKLENLVRLAKARAKAKLKAEAEV